MKPNDSIFDEELDAFVDQQLNHEDRERVLEAMMHDHQVAEEVYSLYQMKELVQQAYREPPKSSAMKNPFRRRRSVYRWAAAILISVITATTAYQWNHQENFIQETFFDVNAIPARELSGKQVLLHVDSSDPQRIQKAMQTAKKLLQQQHPKEIEVVANGAGLVLVRQGSPYATEVASLRSQYTNIDFKACGFAMENARLKEGHPVILVPQAERVDAALNEILRRLKEGWVYIKA